MKFINLKYSFGIILLFLFMVTACSDFIEISPESNLTTDALYQTDKDFKDALMGCYTAFQDPYDNFWQFSDLRGDDVGSYVPYIPDRRILDDFEMDVNDDLLSDTWEEYYNVIYRLNLLLSRLEEADASSIPNKDQYMAEAKFLRALAYFDIVRIWGDVPMLTEPVSIDESFGIGREDVGTVYDQVIIQDLQEAENLLPNVYSGSEVGRVTAGAAKALLGKVYLTRQNFTEAETTLSEVTTMGYELLDDFNDLFDYDRDEHHSEYIFDIEYIDGGIGLGSEYTSEFMVENQTAGIEIVTALQNKYGIEVINSGSSGSPEDGLFEIFEDEDLRKDITVARGVTDVDGNYIQLESGGVPSLTFKYMTSLTQQNDSKANWKVLRYADVLLMYAEALNENGKTAQALQYLNQVRERAGLAGHVGLSQDETREEIYLERRRELYLEGHRWFDLVRTGRALETMQAQGKSMESHHTVFAIPQNQIEVVNDPSVFPQNPGY